MFLNIAPSVLKTKKQTMFQVIVRRYNRAGNSTVPVHAPQCGALQVSAGGLALNSGCQQKTSLPYKPTDPNCGA